MSELAQYFGIRRRKYVGFWAYNKLLNAITGGYFRPLTQDMIDGDDLYRRDQLDNDVLNVDFVLYFLRAYAQGQIRRAGGPGPTARQLASLEYQIMGIALAMDDEWNIEFNVLV